MMADARRDVRSLSAYVIDLSLRKGDPSRSMPMSPVAHIRLSDCAFAASSSRLISTGARDSINR